MPVPVLIVVGTPSEGLSPPPPLEVAAAGAASCGPHPTLSLIDGCCRPAFYSNLCF